MGKELESERFESIKETKQCEENLDSRFVALDQKAKSQEPVFEDALKRTSYRENIHMSAKVHLDLCKQVEAFCVDRKAYLDTKEKIASRAEAEVCLFVCVCVCACDLFIFCKRTDEQPKFTAKSV